tara:strand:+ start:9563 stop:10222 length:660 start_codon:yes stop_codon:yes gene_type:complete
MAKKQEIVRVQLTTQPVRISFPFLVKKREMKDQKGNRTPDRDRYECAALIPPDTGDHKKIKAAINEAMTAAYGDDWKDEMSDMELAKLPLKRCKTNKWFKEQFPDWFFINSWSKERPNLVDTELEPIMDASKFYAGCWCRLQITLLGWTSDKGGKLCLVSLDNVMWIKDDKKLGGGKPDAKKAFGSDMDFKVPEAMAAANATNEDVDEDDDDEEGDDLF